LDGSASVISSPGDEDANFLDEWCPSPLSITAIGVAKLPSMKKHFPSICVVQADSLPLPFLDYNFDIVFSNALIEYIGDSTAQRICVSECLRVRSFILTATPARPFPVEARTLIPFAHYLPMQILNQIYRAIGRRGGATPGIPTRLCRLVLLRSFPQQCAVSVQTAGFPGTAANYAAIFRDGLSCTGHG